MDTDRGVGIETVYRVDSMSVDLMVKQLIIDSELASECLEHVKESYFLPDEKVYRVLIKALKFFRSNFNESPTHEIMKCVICASEEVISSVASGNDLKPILFVLIDEAFNIPRENMPLNREHCRGVVKKFVTERGISDRLAEHISTAVSMQAVIKSPISVLEKFNDVYNSIEAMTQSAVCEIMPDNWKPAFKIGEPWGLPYFDKFMTGGVAPGDVYALLGGFASGKTWTAVDVLTTHCANEYAKETAAKAAGIPYTPKIAVYANYEGSIDSIRFRVLAAAGGMPLNSVKNLILNKVPLSTRDSYKDYEVNLYKNIKSEELRYSEAERYERGKYMLNRYARLLDMSGAVAKLGSGYVEELAEQVNKIVKATSMGIAVVIVDYVKLMSDRYAVFRGDKTDSLRTYIRRAPELLGRLIGLKNNCFVFAIHQLSGDANTKAPHTPLHHAMASECKDFGENCQRAFCLGKKDEHTGLQRLDASKLREDEPGLTNYAVIKFDGNSCRFKLEDGWTIDPNAGFIKTSYSGRMMDVPVGYGDRNY